MFPSVWCFVPPTATINKVQLANSFLDEGWVSVVASKAFCEKKIEFGVLRAGTPNKIISKHFHTTQLRKIKDCIARSSCKTLHSCILAVLVSGGALVEFCLRFHRTLGLFICSWGFNFYAAASLTVPFAFNLIPVKWKYLGDRSYSDQRACWFFFTEQQTQTE